MAAYGLYFLELISNEKNDSKATQYGLHYITTNKIIELNKQVIDNCIDPLKVL